MRRRTRSRWLVLGFAVSAVAGFTAVAIGAEDDQIVPAEPGEPTYVFSDLEVVYPFVDPIGQEEDFGRAGVVGTAEWSGDEFPHEAECLIEVLDKDGNVVGQLEYSFVSLKRHVKTTPIDGVPVTGTPASARGYCAAGDVPPPGSGYVITNPRIVNDVDRHLGKIARIVGDVAWKTPDHPGHALCEAKLVLKDGSTRVFAFTTEMLEGEQRDIVPFLPDEQAAGIPFDQAVDVIGLSCGPITGKYNKYK